MVTACQSACPTRAIHFGDLNQKESDVSKLRRAPQHYTLLAELNTRPRDISETHLRKRRRVSMSAAGHKTERWIDPRIDSLDAINIIITAPILAPAPTWRWWTVFAVSGAFAGLMAVTATWLFAHGIGIFGNNTTVVWGFPIANYVW